MIVVRGVVQASADTVEELTALCVAQVLASRREEGCITHEVAIDALDPHRLVFFEQWSAPEALRAHFGTAASAAYMARLRELAPGRIEMKVYRAEGVRI